MKYTRYLIKGDYIHLENFETNNKYLEIPLIMFLIPSVILCFLMIVLFTPVMVGFDTYRNVRYVIIKFDRKHNYSNNISDIVTNTITYRIIIYTDKIITNKIKEFNEQANILSNSFTTIVRDRTKCNAQRVYTIRKDGFRRSEMRGLRKEQVVSFAKRFRISA